MIRARGFVLTSLVAFIVLICTVLLLGASTQQAQQLLNREAAERTAYLQESAQALRVWYRANQATVDAGDTPLDVNAVLAAAGVSLRYRLRAASSRRLVQGELGFHMLVLWLPPLIPDSSVFDPATGAFTPAPGVAFVRVSGAEVQALALRDTRRILAEAAAMLEAYFAARARAEGEDVRVNYFRPDSACTPPPGAMPCLDSYVAANLVDWAAAGVDGVALRDAWGGLLEVSNLTDSATLAPPYSMAIRASAPWGTILQAQAVQRL
jgi:Tfp pilus assembly protein PilE